MIKFKDLNVSLPEIQDDIKVYFGNKITKPGEYVFTIDSIQIAQAKYSEGWESINVNVSSADGRGFTFYLKKPTASNTNWMYRDKEGSFTIQMVKFLYGLGIELSKLSELNYVVNRCFVTERGVCSVLNGLQFACVLGYLKPRLELREEVDLTGVRSKAVWLVKPDDTIDYTHPSFASWEKGREYCTVTNIPLGFLEPLSFSSVDGGDETRIIKLLGT
jgi:hypothetical protein